MPAEVVSEVVDRVTGVPGNVRVGVGECFEDERLDDRIARFRSLPYAETLSSR